MAYLTIKMFSNCLRRHTAFDMIIPNDLRADRPQREEKPMKTLFLLHGYTGSAGNWVPEWLTEKYNFAIVMPSGENGFWLDGQATGHQFESLIAVELVDYVRKTFGLAMKAEDTCIMGMSMGGFGALHTALAHPDRFGKAGGMSSALIVHGIAGMKPGQDNGMANYDYYRECFGDLETVVQSRANPEVLVEELLARGEKLPEMYMCCGTEDFLLEANRHFHAFLEEKGVKHVYMESAGAHDMPFWDEYTRKIIPWMFEE